jgi:hypothetical protein
MTMDQEPTKHSPAESIVLTFVFLLMIGCIIWSEIADSKAEQAHTLVIEYDCRLAEISPDYPQQVREQCRKRMMPTVKAFK